MESTKIDRKKEERKKQDDKKKADFKLGFMNGLTGRDIFTFNPDLITNDDDDAGNDIDYRQRADDELEEEGGNRLNVRDIDASYFAAQAKEVDDTGTIAGSDRFDYIQSIEKEKAKSLLSLEDLKLNFFSYK